MNPYQRFSPNDENLVYRCRDCGLVFSPRDAGKAPPRNRTLAPPALAIA